MLTPMQLKDLQEAKPVTVKLPCGSTVTVEPSTSYFGPRNIRGYVVTVQDDLTFVTTDSEAIKEGLVSANLERARIGAREAHPVVSDTANPDSRGMRFYMSAEALPAIYLLSRAIHLSTKDSINREVAEESDGAD
jgi:hypothetical protein